MVIPVNPNQTKPWAFSGERHTGRPTGCPCCSEPCTSQPDSPLPDASVFVLGPPTDLQRAAILDAGAAMTAADEKGDRNIAIRTGSIRRLRVRYGLRGVERNFPGWETMPDPMGGSRPVPTDDFLATIPDTVAQEMDEAIQALTDLSTETVGNSGPPSEAASTAATPERQTHAEAAEG